MTDLSTASAISIHYQAPSLSIYDPCHKAPNSFSPDDSPESEEGAPPTLLAQMKFSILAIIS